MSGTIQDMEGFKEVTPTKMDKRKGRTEEVEYDFYMVEIPEQEPNLPAQVEVSFPHPGFMRWKYPGKPEVFITSKRVVTDADKVTDAHKRQAYFAISILEDRGLVKGYRRL